MNIIIDTNEYIINNVDNSNIGDINKNVYVFSNVEPGNPYVIKANVQSNEDLFLTDYTIDYMVWPVSNIEGLPFTSDDNANIAVYIDIANVTFNYIPVHVNNTITRNIDNDMTVRFDFYAESDTHKFKYTTDEFNINSDLDNEVIIYLEELEPDTTYHIYYSTHFKYMINDCQCSNWYYVNAHDLVGNVDTAEAEPRIHIYNEMSGVESLSFTIDIEQVFVNSYIEFSIYKIPEYVHHELE